MEEFVRRLIHEKRVNDERRAKPSEAFERYFGPEHGVELLLPERYDSKLLSLAGEDNA